ncbi:MAG: GAF domain-containing protein, partial [Anaerolineales bacterium]|nr:GAF domain-containing protein [Anaerolineales bacterium]
MKLANGTIRTRLLVGFVLSTLLPILIVTLVSLVVGYRNGRQQVIDRLDSVSALKGQEIKSLAHSFTNELVIALNEEYALDRINVVLDLADDDKFSQFFNKAVRWRFQFFLQQSKYLEELFLVDPEGMVVLSTDMAHEGTTISLKENFLSETADSYIRIISPSKEDDRVTIYSVLPIPGADQGRIGALVGKSNANSLEALLVEQHNIGKTGKILLLDPDSVLISSSVRDDVTGKLNNGFKISTTGSEAAIKDRIDGSAIYHDHLGARVLGAYRWLPEFDIALLVEQDLAEAFSAIYSTLVISIAVAFASALISVVVSLIITRSISNPLEKLVITAASITSGDFAIADIDRKDEIGVLATAFNSMTVQLKSLFTSLEQRVEERTRALQQVNTALEQRASMLHNSSQVSRQITSILYLSDLLSRVVESIKQAFDYYHVQVYLVDHENNCLAPGAASGMQGEDRQPLAIGAGSVNGQAVQTNQAILVDDVSQYPNFLYDDNLPLTRSELVSPLRVGDKVIGTLDIQSSKNNAFTPEDVLIIQSLADQLA